MSEWAPLYIRVKARATEAGFQIDAFKVAFDWLIFETIWLAKSAT